MAAYRILIAGGAGFIGSALAREMILNSTAEVLVFDALTYATTSAALDPVRGSSRFRFIHGDIADPIAVRAAIGMFNPDVVVNLAAETHVDRSIDGPAPFLQSNVVGVFVLLEEVLAHWRTLSGPDQAAFRYHQVSTDEVFGSLGPTGAFSETTCYAPRSPYSATKAAADHFVRAWGHTYGLPVVVTNCSNNYGPFQFPEKLIPLTIVRALAGDHLPVYGDGLHVRDWLHVDDHVRGLRAAFERGRGGQTYVFGGETEKTNIALVNAICSALDTLMPRPDARSYAELIRLVDDRPGHDRRYAVDTAHTRQALGWSPRVDIEHGLLDTVDWYLRHREWWTPLLSSRDAVARRGLAGG
ncbi:dTDP-glucose 4,6-dehydratase [Brevundimonas sp. AJA228-03]|uniref:dTDP-glucose 4,6-dehydratase n=1 Tax=Brevundimonas sp. AJA228-03 TaxID=2752515 RepID=UPI001FD833D2|nr:dTDP-glucose 4,6-dehydratase [Brevundimonas sp. AJA228-03]